MAHLSKPLNNIIIIYPTPALKPIAYAISSHHSHQTQAPSFHPQNKHNHID